MSAPLTLPGFPAVRAADQVVVDGLVERVVYSAPDGDFAVLRLEVPGELVPVSVVGALGHVREGESLRVAGQWEEHPQYGRRLKVQLAEPYVPPTELGIERYLATLAGLGPESARRLTGLFGVRALEVLENETWRAGQVKGLGKRRAQRAAADARARREEREVMVFLQGYGVSASFAVKIRKAYGAQALQKVKSDPYQLARDVSGIGFQSADRIAQAMGLGLYAAPRLEAGLEYTLEGACEQQGHSYLPRAELLSRAQRELRLLEAPPEGEPLPAEPASLLADALASLELRQRVRSEGDRVYPLRLHRAEVTVAARLRALRDAPRAEVPVVKLDGGPLRLAAGQRRALEQVAESPLCVITGGPGTGKTTIIRALVAAWEQAQRRVLLVAPTGRAAKRLSEATGRPASTVHRLLEWAPGEGFRRRADRQLEVDLLVCDEASMLDLPLSRALLSALPEGVTLVLVGDVDQLPSVGPGRVLGDLIDSGVVAVTRLDEIFRQAEGSGIVVNAHRILSGQLPLSAERGEALGDFYLIEAEEPAQARDLVVRLCTARIPQRFGLDPVREVQVLTPMHRGEAGTEELNRVLQAALNPAGEGPAELKRAGRVYRVGDKVMQIRNDYDRDVWNGDVGVVRAVDVEEGELLVRFDEEREVVYGVEALEQLELAYAMSVHKSQGSEYPAVVVPLLMQHYVLLRRNLLYTAVTRGKRLVVLVGSRRALARAVGEAAVGVRYSRLAERLRGEP